MRNTNVLYASILRCDGWKVRELATHTFPRAVLSWGSDVVTKGPSPFPDEVSVTHLIPTELETKFRNF